MWRQELLFATAMYFGHGAFWTYCFNALHATPLPCPLIRALERLLAFLAAAPLLALPWWATAYDNLTGYIWFDAYRYFCWGVSGFTVASWCIRQWHSDQRSGLVSDEVESFDVKAIEQRSQTHGRWSSLANIPGNQVESFRVHRKTLAIGDLPKSWEDVSIAHLTDLHLTGRMAKSYYEHVVEQTQALQADIIVLTGDIIENVDCLDWLDSTLGRLSAPLGVFFVLGNHDARMPDVGGLRRKLAELGMIDVGVKTIARATERGPLFLGGNEMPWFGPPADIPNPNLDALRLALIHTPDQFPWAVQNRFHLALAGHTHGGQIRFPLIGTMICPSYFGCRYAGGVFRRGETVMHVSRGVAALHPIRMNCAPEIALLTLVNRSD